MGKEHTLFQMEKVLLGLWKDSAPWNISRYNEKGEFVKYVDGKEKEVYYI